MKYLTKDFCQTIIGYSDDNLETLIKITHALQGKPIPSPEINSVRSILLDLFTIHVNNSIPYFPDLVDQLELKADDNGFLYFKHINDHKVNVKTAFGFRHTDGKTAGLAITLIAVNDSLWRHVGDPLSAGEHAEFFEFYYHYLHCLGGRLSYDNAVDGSSFYSIID